MPTREKLKHVAHVLNNKVAFDWKKHAFLK